MVVMACKSGGVACSGARAGSRATGQNAKVAAKAESRNAKWKPSRYAGGVSTTRTRSAALPQGREQGLGHGVPEGSGFWIKCKESEDCVCVLTQRG